MNSQLHHPRRFSLEFFPPRTPEAVGRLATTSERLGKLQPDYCSVTFGAGGSTRERTFETAVELRRRTGAEAVPHVSCIGFPLDEIRGLLAQYKAAGFAHLVALRGDMPSGTMGFGELRYADELVSFIRAETGNDFYIEVAAYPEMHPQAGSFQRDLANFRRKVEAGANAAITQYFFNPDAYFRFVDACEKMQIDIPITPGIMPITSCIQLVRFSEACGAEIPRWILNRLRDFGDDRVSIRAFGVDVAVELCGRLLERGAPGLHFYTMNQAEAVEAIWTRLDLGRHRGTPAARAAGG